MGNTTSLVILAAGMGSRYGGLKQIDEIGPRGETIIDHSLYDALQAGFNKIVFIIRKSFEEDFRRIFDNKLKGKAEVHYVFQEMNPLVPGLEGGVERTKPWGTGHAMLVAGEVVKEPFAIINADDYYGQSAFKILYDFLNQEVSESVMGMVGYVLDNTLSDFGHVNRGVCKVNDKGELLGVKECTKISRNGEEISYPEGEEQKSLSADSIVSMNFWGFHPSIFPHLEDSLYAFMRENKQSPTAEYYIPTLVDQRIASGEGVCKVLTSEDKWYGVTYREDRPMVENAFRKLHAEGKYPEGMLSQL